jgi:hypothetical protein
MNDELKTHINRLLELYWKFLIRSERLKYTMDEGGCEMGRIEATIKPLDILSLRYIES